MVFVFDLDDTVCDTDGFSEKYILNFFRTHNLPYKQIAKEVRFAEAKFDWACEYAHAWYLKFGDEMMANFPCKSGAIKLINKLYDAGHKVVIATARANDWHTDPVGITKNWLAKVGLKYHKIYIGRIDKEAICQAENADFFVDDDVNITGKTAAHFAETGSGKEVFLMTSAYNKNLQTTQGVTRVRDFDDLAKKLKAYSINLGE